MSASVLQYPYYPVGYPYYPVEYPYYPVHCPSPARQADAMASPRRQFYWKELAYIVPLRRQWDETFNATWVRRVNAALRRPWQVAGGSQYGRGSPQYGRGSP